MRCAVNIFLFDESHLKKEGYTCGRCSDSIQSKQLYNDKGNA